MWRRDFLKSRFGCSNGNNGHLNYSASLRLDQQIIQTYPEFERAKPLIKYIIDSEERIVPKRCIVKEK